MQKHQVGKWVIALLLGAMVAAVTRPAHAHWCDCLWASRYNIVIRPETDSVDLPASPASATLKVWVQNNMGYPLIEYQLEAYSSVATVGVGTPTLKFGADSQGYRYLLPGESAEQVLTITSSGAATRLGADDISFYVHFSNPENESNTDQGRAYGDHESILDVSNRTANPPGTAAVVKLSSGDAPVAPAIDADNKGSQARHLVNSARVDFGGTSSAAGLANLFNEYCAGKGSWAADSVRTAITDCTSSSVTGGSFNCCGADGTTVCNRHTFTGGGDKYEWQHLWAASELGYRKSLLTAPQLTTLRERLLCGAYDGHMGFKGQALFVLGYLGADTATQTELTTRLSTATGGVAAMIKAALYMMSGGASYADDMDTCVGMGEPYAEMVCAAAKSHVQRAAADATVEAELIQRVYWGPHPPESQLETAHGLFAAHVLNVLAWDRRGWTKGGGNNGTVSFYSVVQDTTPPVPPVNPRCSVLGTGTARVLRVAWDGVSDAFSYKLYQGSTARPGTCSDPASLCHTGTYVNAYAGVPSPFHEPSGLTAGATYYFAVTATDAAGNESAFSAEIACDAPAPQHAPVAVLTCDRTSGIVPPDVTVTCDCQQSTDADGDIEHCWFSLNGATAEDHPTGSWTHTFTTPRSSTLWLRVVDATSLEGSTSTMLAINSATNQSPSAVIVPSATSCTPGATLDFASTGSNDTDGNIVSYRWIFSDDQSEATTETASHTFATAGTVTVTLEVTDDAGAVGTAVATILVSATANEAPVLTDASVPAELRPNTDFTCDGRGVYDPENGVVTLVWDFGDGTGTSTGETATHRYGAEGTYTVSLTATDDGQPPATSRREWQVHVTVSQVTPQPTSAGKLVTSCAGGPPASGLGFVLLSALAFLVLARRRER